MPIYGGRAAFNGHAVIFMFMFSSPELLVWRPHSTHRRCHATSTASAEAEPLASREANVGISRVGGLSPRTKTLYKKANSAPRFVS